MKIAIIGTVGLPAKYGGFETLAEHLVSNLGDHNLRLSCLVLSWVYLSHRLLRRLALLQRYLHLADRYIWFLLPVLC